MTATSRMMWALARENAWRASKWISKIQGSTAPPINSIFVTAIIDMLLALISLGSTTAFNAFAGIVIQGYFTDFIVLTGGGLYWRISSSPANSRVKKGPFSLGTFGIPITVVALIYSIVGFVFSFWPPTPDPTVQQFNWSIVVWIATLIASLLCWQLQARHVYTGPLVEVPYDA